MDWTKLYFGIIFVPSSSVDENDFGTENILEIINV